MHDSDIAEGLNGIQLIAAADPAEEALVIALALRETLEHDGRTAALVTPDRDLARRVAAELSRWEIAIHDFCRPSPGAHQRGRVLLFVGPSGRRRNSPPCRFWHCSIFLRQPGRGPGCVPRHGARAGSLCLARSPSRSGLGWHRPGAAGAAPNRTRSHDPSSAAQIHLAGCLAFANIAIAQSPHLRSCLHATEPAAALAESRANGLNQRDAVTRTVGIYDGFSPGAASTQELADIMYAMPTDAQSLQFRAKLFSRCLTTSEKS